VDLTTAEMPVRDAVVDPACEFEKDSNRRNRSGQHLEERMGRVVALPGV